MNTEQSIVLDIRLFGSNSLVGTIFRTLGAGDFDNNYDNIFGWDKDKPKLYFFLILVPKESIKAAHEEAKELQLRSFQIVSNEGMIIGG